MGPFSSRVLPELDGQHPVSHPPAAFFMGIFKKGFFGIPDPFVHVCFAEHFASGFFANFFSIQGNDCSHRSFLAFMCFIFWGLSPLACLLITLKAHNSKQNLCFYASIQERNRAFWAPFPTCSYSLQAAFLQAAFPVRCFSRCSRQVLNSSPMSPSRSIQHRKAYFSLSVSVFLAEAFFWVRA